VSGLEGTAVKATNNTFKGLSQLGKHIFAAEQEMQHSKRETVSLWHKLVQVEESFENRVQIEADRVSITRFVIARVSQFEDSSVFTEGRMLLSALGKHIFAVEEEMQHSKRETVSLWHKLVQVEESFENRVQIEADRATCRANELEKHIRHIRSRVGNLCNALKEVRELAE
jgi:hypothetical protein